jgi:RimJ/RimL family protein N-acetyltransferase
MNRIGLRKGELMQTSQVSEFPIKTHLRWLRPDDASGLSDLVRSDRYSPAFAIPRPSRPSDAAMWIASVTRDRLLGRAFTFAVTAAVQTERHLVGISRLRLSAGASAQLSYWIAPAYRGSGCATSAARSCIEITAADLEVQRIPT